MKNKTIEDYTVTELKALAFDELQKLEVTQHNLKIINDQLKKLSETPEEPKKK